ncbi:MAG: DNA-directed RNA polymerase [Candidatus Diapherotrites archaeon]|uniref:DNA-directed RNA polymerase subunit Rpo7 n=1 Tax=Candidatus Iainarchaeum sp. TaxID=3101447 RepID=A0A7J4K3M3_9ARCH|nr:MAG: DNA-directed RNA polymerase subunit E' [archaeon GW2011_AR21]MBS3058322.1 DNA-directed RNA polymerase [Candidatus Diapherotrites archaeon]HIH22086.1 DNA-directed RNA polymerase [Candidatus Diapherotrites archaeon]
MYQICTVNDTVRVPPGKFSEDTNKTILKIVQEQYEGLVDEDLGVVVAVINAHKSGEGKVVPGDGAAYYDADLDLLMYKPIVQEVVEGTISEITEFGAFIKTGPLEGLIHVSQIMDDYINHDAKLPGFIGKESNKKLVKADTVIARIVTVSLRGTIPESKIGLTMRQFGLGKDEWLKLDEKRKEKKETDKQKKADKEARAKGGDRLGKK